MKFACEYVDATDAGGEIFQVLFEAVRDQEDGPYLLLQRAFFEEDEGESTTCYIETNEDHLIGHYSKVDALLSRNQLSINLPPPVNETIEVDFQASGQKFGEVKRMLAIILPEMAVES